MQSKWARIIIIIIIIIIIMIIIIIIIIIITIIIIIIIIITIIIIIIIIIIRMRIIRSRGGIFMANTHPVNVISSTESYNIPKLDPKWSSIQAWTFHINSLRPSDAYMRR